MRAQRFRDGQCIRHCRRVRRTHVPQGNCPEFAECPPVQRLKFSGSVVHVSNIGWADPGESRGSASSRPLPAWASHPLSPSYAAFEKKMDILQTLTRMGITLSAANAAAYGVFQFLSKKWLDARFAERLEKFKHDQIQEIERLRYRINALMDRPTKL